MKEEKICCCGHTKTAHKKNPEKKHQFPRDCQECPCIEFQDKKRPYKSDKIIAWGMPSLYAAIVILLASPIVLVYMDIEETQTWNKEIDFSFTKKELFFWGGMALMLLLLVFSPIFLDPISDYFRCKNRKRW